MRRSLIAPWCLSLLLSQRLAAQAPAPTITRDTLAEGIYLFRAPSALELWTATNVVVIVNRDDVTVFDSFTRAGTARAVIAEIRKLTSRPVRTLINSHWHQDHWSGNQEFQKAWPGVQIIATTGTRDYMTRMGPEFFASGIERGAAAARAALDSAVRTGKQADGSPLTPAARQAMEKDLAETEAFGREVRGLRRVLPTVAYRDTLILWSGDREFRLYSVTGDATASTVLYLPAEKLLVTGDALVAQENGQGPPPWTTNSFAITPWLESLRALERLDVRTIVPGQGVPFHDKSYLQLTIRVYDAVINQVHSALERGVVGLEMVQAAIDVDSLGQRYGSDGVLAASFRPWVGRLAAKVYQESLDGVAR